VKLYIVIINYLLHIYYPFRVVYSM